MLCFSEGGRKRVGKRGIKSNKEAGFGEARIVTGGMGRSST